MERTPKSPLKAESPEKAPRASLYLRVSSGPQEAGTSLESQFAVCHAKAAAMEAQVLGVHQDVQSGADYRSRGGLQKALAQIESGEANVLVLARLDRTGREVDSLRDIRRRVEKAGGSLVFADGMTFEKNAVGNLMFTQLSAFAEFERELIRERTTNGHLARARSGIQTARAKWPYGYAVVTKETVMEGRFAKELLGTYQVIEEQAKTVRQIFAWYAGGDSLRAIADKLLSQGLDPTNGGQKWHPSRIRYMLQNPVYRGKATYGRHAFDSDETRLERGFASKLTRRMRDEADWIFIAAPPIIEEKVWSEVQARLSDNQQRLGGNRERKFMLSGMLKCPHCGGPMGGHSGALHSSYRNKAGDLTIYAATRRYRCRQTRCPCNYYNAQNIEDLVIQQLIQFASRPALLQAYFKERAQLQLTKRPTAIARRAELERKLKSLDKRRESLIEGLSRSIAADLGPEVYTSFENKLLQLKSDAAPLREEWENLREVVEETPAEHQTKSLQIAATLKNVEAVLNSSVITPVEKHDLLSLVIVRIEVPQKTRRRMPIDHVKIHFK